MVILSKCNTCQLNYECEHFKEIYKKVEKLVDDNISKNKEISKNNYPVSPNLWQTQHEWLDHQKPAKIKDLLKDFDNVCKFEGDIVSKITSDLDSRYNFKENPALNVLLTQIIDLQLSAFRISLTYNRFGVVREIATRSQSILVPTPGMQYTIGISREISNILQTMDKIAFGEKHIIDNVTTIEYDDVFKKVKNNKVINVKTIN